MATRKCLNWPLKVLFVCFVDGGLTLPSPFKSSHKCNYVCVCFHPHAARWHCSQGQAARQSGSHRGITQASPPLNFYLEEIFSIFAGGRTNSPKAGGENLEISIVFAASSLRRDNNLSVRRSRLFILFTLWLLLLDLYRLEAVTKKSADFVWDILVKHAARLTLAQDRQYKKIKEHLYWFSISNQVIEKE